MFALLYSLTNALTFGFAKRKDDDDMTILMCAQKLTDASLIHRTELETKNIKEKN